MYPTNYINPNSNFFALGQGGNPLPAVITPQSLAPVAPLPVIPTVPTALPNITNLPNGLPVAPIDPAVQQSSQATSILNRVASLTGGNQAVDTTTAKNAATAPYEQQLNQINQQIQTNQANALQMQEKALQMGESSGFASREAQNAQRTSAIETLKLSALQAGLQGNISLAEKRATDAVAAQYADRVTQLQTAKSNLYGVWDSLTPSEKKRAEAQLLSLDSQDAFVRNQMDQTKIAQGFVAEAIAMSTKNGVEIPGLVLQRATNAGTATEALQILAPYMQDVDAKAEALLDREYKRAQIDKIYSDAALSKEELRLKYSAEGGQKLTDTQATSLGYANRIAQAGIVIDQLGANFVSDGSLVGQFVPNVFKSDERQQYEQAQRNFINAVLRKESGAVISTEEFDNAKKQYFPQPGDGSSVLVQKKQNRNTIYQNFMRNAGNPSQSSPAVTIPSGADGTSYGYPGYVSDGKQWVKK